jgi:hypothetical protein
LRAATICAEGVGRVVDRAAVHARVEIESTAGHVELDVDQTAQSDGDGRQVALEEARVRDDREVGRQALTIRPKPGVEVDRTRLLLAFEHELEIDRQRPRVARIASMARVCIEMWHLSSDEPRASMRPSFTTGTKGGESHRSTGSTGWTS